MRFVCALKSKIEQVHCCLGVRTCLLVADILHDLLERDEDGEAEILFTFSPSNR